jgi:hypothetical protein
VSAQTTVAMRLAGPVVAAAKGTSGWPPMARAMASSRLGSTVAHSMACALIPKAALSPSMSKYSTPERRSSSIRRRTVDSCQPAAAARLAAVARPSCARWSSSVSSLADREMVLALSASSAGQALEQQLVVLPRRAGLQRAHDLGAARADHDPPRAGPPGHPADDGRSAAWHAPDPQVPVFPADTCAVDPAEYPEADGFLEPAVTAGGGLVRDARHLGQHPERRSRRHG